MRVSSRFCISEVVYLPLQDPQCVSNFVSAGKRDEPHLPRGPGESL